MFKRIAEKSLEEVRKRRTDLVSAFLFFLFGLVILFIFRDSPSSRYYYIVLSGTFMLPLVVGFVLIRSVVIGLVEEE